MGIAKTLLSLVVGMVEFLLSLRFIFKFLSVNPRTPFVDWLYDTTAPLIVPFAGILPNWKLGVFTIDFATLFALIVYVTVGYLILQLLGGKSEL